MLVRYEDILDDTQPNLEAMLGWLGIEHDSDTAREVVEKRSFSAIPEDMKGPGKRARTARPGQWQERLHPTEIRAIEDEMGEKLREVGYTATQPTEMAEESPPPEGGEGTDA